MSKNKKHNNNKQDEISNSNLFVRKQEIHVGPIPSPDTLKQYNEIEPGFANRIITMAENEQNVRLENSKNIVKHSYRLQYLGLILGFILSLITIILGFILIYKGQKGWGAFISLLGFSGIIRTFLHSSKQPYNKKNI